MSVEVARRVHAAAKELLAAVNEGSATCAEMRETLKESKAAVAVISAAQTAAAASIAGRERHGDGGAQVLADAAGLSRHDARSQVKTAQAIGAVPAVRDAVESGRVSQANAKRLAEAVEKTSAADVESDSELLAKAESMRPEQFVREARRWTANRQHDGGAAEFRRLRARRCVRMWDGDDGMVHLRGEFDPVTGKRIANRIRAEAAHLHDSDKTAAEDGAERRSFDQCMADAMDNLTSHTSERQSGGKPLADICVVAHVDDDTGELIAELPDGERLPAEVLEELSCNAKLTGVVYDRTGKPIWRTTSRRTVTESQWQLLIAKWGGCFHCGANPGICQGHHIEPACRGGPTKLDNLVPACWTCHHRIHHDGWQIHKRPDGNHTLHPPDRIRHGPARAPDDLQPLFFTEPSETSPRLPLEPAPTTDRAAAPSLCDDRAAASDPAGDHEPLRTPGPAAARAALRKAQSRQGVPASADASRAGATQPALR